MAHPKTETFDEERLLAVLLHAPAACLIARWRDRRFVDINDAFTQLLGWTRDEILGRTATELQLIDANVAVQLRSHLDGLLMLRDHELTVRTRTGEQRQVVVA